MKTPDPLWANVSGYMGPIRNYNPDYWTNLKQEEILEIELEVTVGDKVYSKRRVLEYDDILGYEVNVLDLHITSLIEDIDKKLRRHRKEEDGARA